MQMQLQRLKRIEKAITNKKTLRTSRKAYPQTDSNNI